MDISHSNKTQIADNLAKIKRDIEIFSQKYQRTPNSVHLLAVSKTKPATDILAAFNAGQTCFGENYLQEAINKIQLLHAIPIEWHFIGSIQSNKTRELAEHFDWVHSVDRIKIAQRLNRQRLTSQTPLNICLQVNISEESSKSGFNIREINEVVEEIAILPNICLRGLMAIPAKSKTLQKQREIFALMNSLFCKLQLKHPEIDTLSMGMSNDMEAAIAEGSTLLRIGSAIFGARSSSTL